MLCIVISAVNIVVRRARVTTGLDKKTSEVVSMKRALVDGSAFVRV